MGNINLSSIVLSLKIHVTYTHDSIITRRKEIKTQTFLVIKSVLSKQLSKIYPFINSINHVLDMHKKVLNEQTDIVSYSTYFELLYKRKDKERLKIE